VTERSSVETVRRGEFAIILIDNPPVNALSHAVRLGLSDAIAALAVDDSAKAVVIAGGGRTFVAGADIKEFGAPRRPPLLPAIIQQLDRMRKPVVAALHGNALGGGLELALACDWRVATPSARLGMPEVKLGLLPGAGGTQRLPRAVGAIPALSMIVTGEPISAGQALRIGLVDEIVEGDVLEAAVAAAERLAARRDRRRLRDNEEKLAEDRLDLSRFELMAEELLKTRRGQRAPKACVEALRAALDLPFEDALQRERALFAELLAGDQSKALRHLFFAERQAAKFPTLPTNAEARAVNRAAIIGAGTMGVGIAISFADAGIEVALIDASEQSLQAGFAKIANHYRSAAERGRLGADQGQRRRDLIKGSLSLSAAANADIVVEAVFEELPLKRAVFAELDRLTPAETILATNTSYLDVDAIAAATRRPASVAGMHFFSPANVMRLVEIVRAKASAPNTLTTLVALARKLGKSPVVVGNCHGFVGNRMLRVRNVHAERLLLEGALPQEIDAAMVRFGFPMGPLAASDLAGLDIGWRMRRAAGLRAEIADALCELGRYGQKTGKGFYRYEPASRTPHPDPEVDALIFEASLRLGIARRSIGEDEIVERLLFPAINEGARILDEGIAARPGDIDVIWAYGFGFPAWRGGPMWYADAIGLKDICSRLRDWARRTGDPSMNPATFLERLAAEGRGFAEWV
jgi:3-hydroxyacyl-CoA dehydrogenase